MSAVTQLRARTSKAHDKVDAAFSAYCLDVKASYERFLLAHAHALIAAEGVLAPARELPVWRPRADLLANDLRALGVEMPDPLTIVADSHPAYPWGVLYVLEGSRLGGRVLADRVPASFKANYLRAVHTPGEWRAFRSTFDAQATAGGDAWLKHAVIGAEACFDLYQRAAAVSPP